MALVADPGRSAGVIKDGWFLVDIVLQGRLNDLGEVALEWVTTDGVVGRKVLLANDLEFAACPASTDPYAPITGLEVMDMLSDVSGTYRSSEELLGISCVRAPGAVLRSGDDSASVARAWSSAAVGGGFFQLEPPFALGLGPVSDRTVTGVVVRSLNPLLASLGSVELVAVEEDVNLGVPPCSVVGRV